jgi:hypothetical protein
MESCILQHEDGTCLAYGPYVFGKAECIMPAVPDVSEGLLLCNGNLLDTKLHAVKATAGTSCSASAICESDEVLVEREDGKYQCQREADDAGPEIRLCMSYTDNTRAKCSEEVESEESMCKLTDSMHVLFNDKREVDAICYRLEKGAFVCQTFGMDVRSLGENFNPLCDEGEMAVVGDDSVVQCVPNSDSAVAGIEFAGAPQGVIETSRGGFLPSIELEKQAEGQLALGNIAGDDEADFVEGQEEEMVGREGEQGVVGASNSSSMTDGDVPLKARNKMIRNLHPASLYDDMGLPLLPQANQKFNTETYDIIMPPYCNPDEMYMTAVNYSGRYGPGTVTYSGTDNFTTEDSYINRVIACAPTGSKLKAQ